MESFLNWLVKSEPGQDRSPEFSWGYLPESWSVFILIAIVIGLAFLVFWLYVRELKSCPTGLRITLGVMRFIVLFLLVVAFLQPSISFRRDKIKKPNVVLAVDVSGSMTIADKYRDKANIQRITDILALPNPQSKNFDKYEGDLTREELTALENDLRNQFQNELAEGKIKRIDLVKRALEQNSHAFLKTLVKKANVKVNEFGDESKTMKTIMADSKIDDGSEKKSDEGDSKEAKDKKSGEKKTDSEKSDGKKTEDGKSSDEAKGKDGKSEEKSDAVGEEESEQKDETNNYTPPELPTSNGTNLAATLESALEAADVSSIILVTDGQKTTEADIDPVKVAEEAAKAGIPIFVVGVGDPNKSKNVWVKEIASPLQAVNPGDPFSVIGEIGYRGVDVDEISVQLTRRRVIKTSGEKTVLGDVEGNETKVVKIPLKKDDQDERQGTVKVEFVPVLDEPGFYRYSLEIVSKIDKEDSTLDNRKDSRNVEVTKEKARILLISGAPTWEYQLVRRLLQRDKTYDLSCWLQSMDIERKQEGNIVIDRLPETIEQMGEFNAIILIDPDPQKDLDKNFFDLLKEFAEVKAGGVMFMAGPKYTSMTLSLSKSETLKEILPVEFPDASFILSGFESSTNSSTEMNFPKRSNSHQVMRFFESETDNYTQWEKMPGVYWSYPAVNAKTIARVLIEHKDPTLSLSNGKLRPLLVAGQYKLGNTLYLGFNGTWRWRRIGRQAHFFDAFWINVAKYLVANRSLQGKSVGTIRTDKERVELGELVEFYATLLNSQAKKLDVPSVEAGLYRGDEKIRSLTFEESGSTAGEYQESWKANEIGEFEVRITLGDKTVTKSIMVVEPDDEFRKRSLNLAMLRNIARESGGEYFSIEDLSKVPEVVKASPEITPESTIPEPVWGMKDVRREFLWFCFLLPFVLLTTEWALRKVFKLL